jgi:hypothetical protein
VTALERLVQATQLVAGAPGPRDVVARVSADLNTLVEAESRRVQAERDAAARAAAERKPNL